MTLRIRQRKVKDPWPLHMRYVFMICQRRRFSSIIATFFLIFFFNFSACNYPIENGPIGACPILLHNRKLFSFSSDQRWRKFQKYGDQLILFNRLSRSASVLFSIPAKPWIWMHTPSPLWPPCFHPLWINSDVSLFEVLLIWN